MAASGSPVSDGVERRGVGPSAAVVVCATAVFLFLALVHAGAPSLWNDEVMSVSFARRSWYGLLHGAASDRVHPPFFYALLKVWIRIGGERTLWLRLLPISAATAAILAAARLCRELGLSRRASAIGLSLAATSGYLVYYAQELRPYALLLLTSVLSTLAFVRVLDAAASGRRAWIGLALANTLLVYSHYFGWLVVGTEGLWLVISRRDRERLPRFLASSLVPVLAFAPWAWLVSREIGKGSGLSGNLAGLTRPGPAALPRFYAGLLGPERAVAIAPQLLAGALLLAAILGLAVRARKSPPEHVSRTSLGLLAAFAFIPPAAALLVSLLVRPVFHPRYLVEAAVPFLLLGGAAAAEPARWRLAVTAAAAACCLWSAADQLAGTSRIAWGDLVTSMEASDSASASASGSRCSGVAASAPVYALGEGAPRPVGYYLEKAGSRRTVIPVRSVAEVGPGPGWLAFHSGSELEGVAYWSAASPASVRSALEAKGLRILCEEESGPARRRGVLLGFAPATGGSGS